MNPNEQITELKTRLEQLEAQYFKGNFSASQDMNKYTRFNTRIKVPNFATLPATCDVGELGEFSGKLYICSSVNTWSLVGTQS